MEIEIKLLKNNLWQLVEADELGRFVYVLESSSIQDNDVANALQSIFEKVLTKSDRKLFVSACLAHGARLDKANQNGQYPIHIAASSLNVPYLEILLSCDHTIVNQKTDSKTNALELLYQNITKEDFQKYIDCLTVLLKYNAIIPVSLLNEPSECEEIQIKKALFEKCKIKEEEQNYQVYVNTFKTSEDAWKLRNLKKLKEEGETITPTFNLPNKILTTCCEIGDYNMLEYLFHTLPVGEIEQRLQRTICGTCVEEKLLTVLIHRVNENDADCPYFKCLMLCLSYPLIDIDEADGTLSRALDYAVKYKLKRVQKLLLQKGAYVGGKNTFNRYVLCNIDPIVLKQHLDSCIYTIGDGNVGGNIDQRPIYVMLDNFIPPHYKQYQSRRRPPLSNKSYKSILPALIAFTDESKLSASYDVNKETRLQLIEHPVISTLLYIRDPSPKWYMQVLKAVRGLPLIMLLTINLFLPPCFVYAPFGILLIFLIFELVEHVLYEIGRSGKIWKVTIRRQFRQAKNYVIIVEMCLLVIAACRYYVSSNTTDKTGLTCMTALAGIAMARCIASYSTFEKYMYTLKIVLWNVCKGLLFYSFILVTYITFCLVNNTGTENVSLDSSGNDDHASNQTSLGDKEGPASETFFTMFLNTFTFLTGDINASTTGFSRWSYVCYTIMFVMFVILIPITFSNLLIAFAVGDVSAIRKKSTRLQIYFQASRLYLHEIMSTSFLNKFYPYHDYHDVQYIEMNTKHNNDIKLYVLQHTQNETVEESVYPLQHLSNFTTESKKDKIDFDKKITKELATSLQNFAAKKND